MAEWVPSAQQFAEAHRLVGEFMYNWASLEGQVNSSLADLTGVESPMERAILATNTGFRDKLNTVKTLLDLHGPRTEGWHADAKKLCENIAKHSIDRNVVAHTFFAPEEKGRVKFYVIKAKGKFGIPDVVWTTKNFEAKNALAIEYASALAKLTREAVAVRDRFIAFKSAKAAPQAPQGLPTTQPQAPRSSPRTKREKPPQSGE